MKTRKWSKRSVRRLITASSDILEECWGLLAAMKQGSGGAEILTLQGKLASDLYNLSRAYAEIGTARKELIGRKDKLSVVVPGIHAEQRAAPIRSQVRDSLR